ncbi:MAG: hypothetical protein ACHQE5_08055 [Actinomycetes bacterium]
MRKFLCWLLDHDRMTTSARHRICLRCGTRETLRHFGDVLAWEELPAAAARTSRA